MSVITDWADDYTSADTNTPTSATAIPYPAAGTTDLGEVLRDVKKVIRTESLAKAWETTASNAAYVGTSTFTVAGNLIATYPAGMALNLNLNGTFVYTHTRGLSYSAPNTTITTQRAVLNSDLTEVKFSTILPASTPAMGVYPADVSSSLPWKITQMGQFDVYATETSTYVGLPRTEYDGLYVVLLQPISESGGTATVSHYRVTEVSRSTTHFDPSFASSPGGSVRVRWEYCIVRVT